MILDKQIYPIYGKDLKKFIKLLSNLKDITVRYSTKNGDDSVFVEKQYDDFVMELLNSNIFENVNIFDLQDEYSFLELIKSANLKTNGRN
jgi:hypothetical protein|tara:strand:- start:510 stop:779 length:270 start_codon:yes stop_codon:yes gene_type:complete